MRLHKTVVLTLAIAGLAGVAAAQGVANHANGLDYQPTQGSVLQKEQAAGIALTPRHRAEDNADVEQLNRQLQNTENNDPLVHPDGLGKVNPNR